MLKILTVCLAAAAIWRADVSAQDLTIPKSSYTFSYEDGSGYYFVLCTPPITNVVAWGTGPAINVPGFCLPAGDVSAGWDHGLALLTNGAVRAWGSNDWGQSDVPEHLVGSNAVQVVAGKKWSAALLNDGTGVVWGKFGTGNVTNTLSDSLPIVQIVYTDTNAITGLLNDGTVTTYYPDSNYVHSVGPAIRIASSPGRYVAILNDNSVVSWGGSATYTGYLVTNVLNIACGSAANAALRGDGTVINWSPTGTGGGTLRSGTHYGVSMFGANLWAINSTNGPVKYLGNIGNPASPAPTLKAISVGNGFVLGIKQ